MSTDASIANLLGMARTAQLGGNSAEALTYFNRVLEIDPTVSEAWIGKGNASGWLSTLANIRLGEALVAFNHAIATSSEENRATVTNSVVLDVNKITVALYGMARKQLEQYPSLDNTWVEYLAQVSQMLDALEQARQWARADRTTLENIVHLCKDNIEGYSFRDQFNNNMPGVHHVSDGYDQVLKSKLSGAIQALRELDPSYTPPAIQKQQSQACFVVTATMGDANHPTVHLLRQFRDEKILPRPWGSAAVMIYYFIGPRVARCIAGSKLLRNVSYTLLVTPAAWLAKRMLK